MRREAKKNIGSRMRKGSRRGCRHQDHRPQTAPHNLRFFRQRGPPPSTFPLSFPFLSFLSYIPHVPKAPLPPKSDKIPTKNPHKNSALQNSPGSLPFPFLMDSVPPVGGGGGLAPGSGYPESTDSSPRSRGGDSWDEPFPSSAAAAAAAVGGGRLRLMCSFGGRIVPRPTDRSLCYIGGETRIVAVDRNATLADVHARLSRSLLGGRPFTLKYQLPNEDLDSLISISIDEDLDNLVDEYDRIAASSSGGGSSRTSRIRLFLFPANPESSSSLGSLLDDSPKSENWFVDALNSAISGSLDDIPRGISTDSASVNCLLGLEDDSSTHSRGGVPNSVPAEDQRVNQQKIASAAAGRHPHDVQSVPDSPMLDKNSSFGSTSSAPSLSNLPPIRVRPEDRPPDGRFAPPAAVEDHFAQMRISEQPVPPVVGYMQPPPQVPIPAMEVKASISPSEASSRVFSDDDKSDHGGGGRKPQLPKPEIPPVADPTNRAMYYNDRAPPSELKRDMPVGTDATSYRIPVPAPDAAAAAVPPQPPAGYVYAQMHAPQQPPPPQPQQPQQPAPQQYVTAQNQQQPQQSAPQQYVTAQNQQQPQQPAPQQYVTAQNQQQPQQPAPQQYLTAQNQQQPQQPAPQQYVTAQNQHFIHNPATGTFIPIQSYYQRPVAQPAQPQQSHTFDPNTGMYYTYPNAAAAAPAYAGMGYHHVIQSHHHPAPQPAATMAGNFGYEYADPARAQVFYSQAPPPPTQPAQYQPIGSPDAGQADVKQTRTS